MDNWIKQSKSKRKRPMSVKKVNKKSLPENSESFVTLGSALKALPDGVIGGHLVLFGDKDNRDLTKQFFDDSTYYGHNKGNGAEVVFNHRRPLGLKSIDMETASQLKALAQTFMKNPLKTTVDAIGIFGEIAMDMSNQYEKAIYDLAKRGILKWSAGAAPHLVDVAKNGHIKSFVITEGSLTPVPIEYRMIQHKVLPLKSLLTQIEEFTLK